MGASRIPPRTRLRAPIPTPVWMTPPAGGLDQSGLGGPIDVAPWHRPGHDSRHDPGTTPGTGPGTTPPASGTQPPAAAPPVTAPSGTKSGSKPRSKKVSVRRLQRLLNRFIKRWLTGIKPLKVNGKTGAATRRRIKLVKYYLGYGKGRNAKVNARFLRRMAHPRDLQVLQQADDSHRHEAQGCAEGTGLNRHAKRIGQPREARGAHGGRPPGGGRPVDLHRTGRTPPAAARYGGIESGASGGLLASGRSRTKANDGSSPGGGHARPTSRAPRTKPAASGPVPPSNAGDLGPGAARWRLVPARGVPSHVKSSPVSTSPVRTSPVSESARPPTTRPRTRAHAAGAEAARRSRRTRPRRRAPRRSRHQAPERRPKALRPIQVPRPVIPARRPPIRARRRPTRAAPTDPAAPPADPDAGLDDTPGGRARSDGSRSGRSTKARTQAHPHRRARQAREPTDPSPHRVRDPGPERRPLPHGRARRADGSARRRDGAEDAALQPRAGAGARRPREGQRRARVLRGHA